MKILLKNLIRFYKDEIVLVFHRMPLWTLLAWKEIVSKYKRTVLGPFWLSLAMIVFIFSISLIYSQLLSVEIDTYIPYLSFGVVTWIFISTTIVESCDSFVAYSGYIKQIKIPILIFVLRILVRNNIIFLHNFPMLIFILLFFNIKLTLDMIPMLLLGIIVLNINLLWMSILIAIFSTRYRDVQHMIGVMIQPIFFITPVIWNESTIKNSRFVIDFNPFYYLVESIRGVFIGENLTFEMLVYLGVIGVVGVFIAIIIFYRFHKKIVLWL